jgi:pyruvate dehydrogenase E2 component (dihydrolipoamide acetyltransferase)
VGGERVTPESFDDDRIRATPRARRFAEEKSVDLHEVEGSGAQGAILVADIEAYLAKLETQNEEQDGVRATPLALRVAADLGVDLEHVKGTGPGGRITRADVLGQLKHDKDASKARERELWLRTFTSWWTCGQTR